MWPAVMFANKRIISAKGLVKIPTISIGTIIGIKASGTPGGLKICDQQDLFPKRLVTISVITDKTSVTPMFPVTFADPGSSPRRLFIKMKKNNVNRQGKNF